MTLGQFLMAAAATSHAGPVPCAAWVADWVVARGNADPFAFMRDDSPVRALQRVAEAGGVLPLAQLGMIDALVPEVDEPQVGDVAVIERETDDGHNQACAIYGGDKWVTLGLRGIEAGPGHPLVIWRP